MSVTTNKLKSLILVVFTLLSFKLFAAHALPEFSASYAVQKFGIKVAEAHYQLDHTDTGYKFTQNTHLHGFASMFRNDTVNAVSYVDDVNNELLLKKHSYRQTGKEKNRDEDFSIQWDTSKKPYKGNIKGVVRSKEINLETSTAVWEMLSFQIPLMIEATENKKEYFYDAVLKGEIDTYNFVLTSSKDITFAGEKYQLLQMVRSDPHKKRQTHIWLAPGLYNLPVIVENFRNGKQHSRMQLESVQFDNNKKLSEQFAENEDDF